MTSMPARSSAREDSLAPGIEDESGQQDVDMDYLDQQRAGGADGGYAEIRDHMGNVYMVTLDELAAVGVDINRHLEITEEQMNSLLAMVAAPMEDNSLPAGVIKTEEYEEVLQGGGEGEGVVVGGGGPLPLTISILLDGSIKLVTPSGQESYFSPSQLAEINIDTQNMTDDDIKRIVQLAGAAGEGTYEDVPEKRRKLDSSAAAAADERREGQLQLQHPLLHPQQSHPRSYESMHTPASSSHSVAVPSTSAGSHPGPSGAAGMAQSSSGGAEGGVPGGMRLGSGGSSHSASGGRSGGVVGPGSGASRKSQPVTSSMIGESVKVQNAKGNIVSAVVRYSRPGMGYKVQTPDGKFEWVAPDRIVDRVPRGALQADTTRDYDHKGYTTEAPAAMPSTSSGGGGPLMLPRRLFASSHPSGSSGGRSPSTGASPSSLLHPTVPRGGSLPVRTLPHPSSAAAAGGGGGGAHAAAPPNFCCPVCDRKVYQKEPAYIVIRLPACDSCTREKILIVDDSLAAAPYPSSHQYPRPATRSIGTDTVDLPTTTTIGGGGEEEEAAKAAEQMPSTTTASPDEPTTVDESPSTSEDTVAEGTVPPAAAVAPSEAAIDEHTTPEDPIDTKLLQQSLSAAAAAAATVTPMLQPLS